MDVVNHTEHFAAGFEIMHLVDDADQCVSSNSSTLRRIFDILVVGSLMITTTDPTTPAIFFILFLVFYTFSVWALGYFLDIFANLVVSILRAASEYVFPALPGYTKLQDDQSDHLLPRGQRKQSRDCPWCYDCEINERTRMENAKKFRDRRGW